MLYREIIAVCSQIHIKHINTLCGQNVELLNVKLAVHVVTTRVEKSNASSPLYCSPAPVQEQIHRSISSYPVRTLKSPVRTSCDRIHSRQLKHAPRHGTVDSCPDPTDRQQQRLAPGSGLALGRSRVKISARRHPNPQHDA